MSSARLPFYCIAIIGSATAVLVSACGGRSHEATESVSQALQCLDPGTSTPADWAAPHSYALGDRVKYSGQIYQCVAANTSTADAPPSTRPDLWLIPPPCQPAEWQAQTAYGTGSIVDHNGQRYQATLANTSASSNEPGSSGGAAVWSAVADVTCPAEDLSVFAHVDLPVLSSYVGTIPGRFSVSPNGAASYALPLDVLPGRASIEPSLTISYQSDGGDGLLGLGAALQGLSEISRCPHNLSDDGTLREVRFDSDDKICLDGLRLIPVSSSSTSIEYRTQPDTFRKIVGYLDTGSPQLGPLAFQVFNKDGRVFEYGGRVTSVAGSDELTSRAMANGGVVARWAVSRVSDRSGNYMDVVYENDRTSEGDGDYTAKYMPKAIRYTGHQVPGAASPDRSPERTVQFTYGQPRFHQPDRYVHGLHLFAPDLLTRIDVNGPKGTAHSYSMSYVPGGASTSAPPTPTVSGRDRLVSISDADPQTGRKSATHLIYGTTSGTYSTTPTFAATQTQLARFDISPDVSLFSPFLVPFDLDGDGLDDLILVTRTLSGSQDPSIPIQNRIRVALQRTPASVKQTDPVRLRGIPSAAAASFSGGTEAITWNGYAIEEAVPLDYDGDGDLDLMIVEAPPSFQGLAHPLKWMQSVNGTLSAPQDTGVELSQLLPYFTDLNGDGVLDLLMCSGANQDQWEARIWAPGGAPFGSSIPISSLDGVPCSLGQALAQAGSSDVNVRTYQSNPSDFGALDLNGDGAQEILVPENVLDMNSAVEAVSWDPSTRTFGPKKPTGLTHLAISGYRALDLNGDGLPDLVSLSRLPNAEDDQIPLDVRFNTGNGFVTAARDSADTMTNAALQQSVLLDANGDGRADLLVPGSSGQWEIWSWVTPSSTNSISAPHFNRQPLSLATSTTVKFSAARIGTASHANGFVVEDIASEKVVVLVNGGDPAADLLTAVQDEPVSIDPSTGPSEHVQSAVGHVDGISYAFLQAAHAHIDSGTEGYLGDSGCTYPMVCARGYKPLVTEFTTLDGTSDLQQATRTQKVRIAYLNAHLDLLGRGWLGFGQIRMQYDSYPTRVEAWLRDNSTLDGQERFPRAGLVTDHWVMVDPSGPADGAHVHVQYQQEVIPRANGSRTFSYAMIEQDEDRLTSVTFDSSGSPTGFVAMGTHQTFTPRTGADGTPDEAGNVAEVLVTAAGVPATSHSVDTAFRYEQEDTSNWLVGLPTHVTSTSTEAAPDQTRTQTRELSIHYNQGLPDYQVLAPGNPDRQLWTRYSRDTFGNVTLVKTTGNENSVSVLREQCTAFDAEESMFPAVTANSLGQVTRTKYDHNLSRAIQRVDPNGLTTQWGYDTFGRIAALVRPDHSSVSLVRDVSSAARLGSQSPNGATASWFTTEHLLDSSGADVIYAYDYSGRLARRKTRLIGSQNDLVEEAWDYDSLGLPLTHTLPHATAAQVQESVSNDALGRPVARSRLIYDDNLNPTQTFLSNVWYTGTALGSYDARNNGTSVQLDPVGRVQETFDASRGTIGYTYGPFDRVIAITDPLGHKIAQDPDAYGIPSNVTSPDRGTQELTTSAFGQTTKEVVAGRSKQYTYDALGRLTRLVDDDGTTTWTWDTGRNAIGRISSVSGPESATSVSYGYDEFGRQQELVQTDALGSASLVLTYDDRFWIGRLSEILYPDDAFAVQYQYDDWGNPVLIENPDTGETLWSLTGVDKSNRVTDDAFGNSVLTRHRDYSDAHGGALADITTMAGGSVVQALAYQYDPNDNLLSRTDNGGWQWQGTTADAQEESFCYDTLDRLTDVDPGQTPCRGGSLLHNVYDADGSFQSKSDVGSYTYDPVRVHTVSTAGGGTYTYDGRGNQVTRPRPPSAPTGLAGTTTIRYSALDLPRAYLFGNVVSWTGSATPETAACSGEASASGAATQGPMACLIGTDSLAITDATTIHLDAAAKTLDVGAGAKIDGNVAVLTTATLHDHASITGRLDVGGGVTLGNGATVGTLNSGATVGVPVIPTIAFSAGSTSHEVRNDTSETIPVGSYGDLMVRARSTATFVSGTYNLSTLHIEPSAKVRFDTSAGAININVKGSVAFDGPIDFGASNALQVALYSDGCDVTFNGSMTFPGTVTAPHATVQTRSGALVKGCVWGRIVQIGPQLDNAVGSKADYCYVDGESAGVQVTCSDNASVFRYDGNGTRIGKITHDKKVLYASGLYQRVLDVASGQVTHKYYVPSPAGMVAVHNRTRDSSNQTVGTDATQYLLTDHLGSLDVVTDATGAAIDRRSYDAFGQRRGQRSNVASTGAAEPLLVGYAGHEDDPEMGLVNMNGRIYDPRIAQFLNPDTLPSGTVLHSQRLHPYGYVYNNPLSWLDPTGFYTETWTESSDPGVDWDLTICWSCGDTPPAPAGPVTISLDTSWSENNFGWGDLSTVSAAPMVAAFNNAMNDAIGTTRQATVEVAAFSGTWAISPATTMFIVAYGLLNPDPANAPVLGGSPIARQTPQQRLMQIAVPVVLGGLGKGFGGPRGSSFDPGQGELLLGPTGETAGAAEGLGARSVGAMAADEAFLNWSAKSTPTWGHTFLTHGEAEASSLLGRAAGTGQAQGMWLNNEAAAQFLSAERAYIQGPASLQIPEGLGVIIRADGTIVPAGRATLIPAPGGGFRTAFPIE